MRILLTGATGFLGGRLCEFLAQFGELTVFVRNRKKLRCVLQNIDVIEGDYFCNEELYRACDGADLVVHLAGMNARQCGVDPEGAIAFNICGTSKLVRAAEDAGCTALLYFSTGHVYGELKGDLTEETLPRPRHPYGWTKRAAEDVVLSSSKLSGTIFRLSNVVGAPAHSDADCWTLVGPDLCRQAVTRKKLTLRGNGREYRNFMPFSDLEEVLRVFIPLMLDRKAEGIFNVGGARSITVYMLAEMVAEYYKNITGQTISIETGAGEDMNEEYNFSTEKLRSKGIVLQNNIGAEVANLLNYCAATFGEGR